MKLKDNKNCQCFDRDVELTQGQCRFGYCTTFRCPWCNMFVVDWGPITCPHKKNENGTLRWYKYPAMDEQAVHWGTRGTRRRKSGYT